MRAAQREQVPVVVRALLPERELPEQPEQPGSVSRAQAAEQALQEPGLEQMELQGPVSRAQAAEQALREPLLARVALQELLLVRSPVQLDRRVRPLFSQQRGPGTGRCLLLAALRACGAVAARSS